jgi:hypothetical protein
MNGTQGNINSGGTGNGGVSIFLTLPKSRRNGDNIESNQLSKQYAGAGNLVSIPMDQTITFSVGILPTTQVLLSKIKESNPTIFLFRKVKKQAKTGTVDKYRKGFYWVHPTSSSGGVAVKNNHRFHCGNPSSTTGDRLTEFAITNNDFEFYTGTKTNPNGMTFDFRPLQWFNYDIYQYGLTFPQAIYNPNQIKPFIGSLQEQKVAETNTNAIYTFVSGKRNGKRKLNPSKYFWGVQLWIDNPDYDNSTQVPAKIPISNMAEFTMGYKTINAINDANDFMRYAIDWKFNIDGYNR